MRGDLQRQGSVPLVSRPEWTSFTTVRGCKVKSSTTIACEILDELKGRGGFDNWWDDVDDATRDEILTRLASIIGEGQQGSSTVECRAHNPKAAGSTPAPASIQAPIVRVTINDNYEIASCAQYAPGLPPGDHDLYCEPTGSGSNS